MPVYLRTIDLIHIKPLGKFFAMNVKRHGRGQVIVNDAVNFDEGESRTVAQVICVKQEPLQASLREWRRKQIEGSVQNYSRDVGSEIEQARRYLRREMFAQRVDDVYDPAVVFAPVNPGRDRSARFDVFDQRIETAARIGQVM